MSGFGWLGKKGSKDESTSSRQQPQDAYVASLGKSAYPVRNPWSTKNPLRLHLPLEGEAIPAKSIPAPDEIEAWLLELPAGNSAAVAQQTIGLMRGINLHQIPASQHLATLAVVQSHVDGVVDKLRGKYRNHPMPLDGKLRDQADLAQQLLEQMALGYKLIVNDAIANKTNPEFTEENLLTALNQAIILLGQLVLEHMIQYKNLSHGFWGELHRLYQLAENNRAQNTRVSPLDPTGSVRGPSTIKKSYIQAVMLALTQPNHLLSGQVEMIYNHLKKWSNDVDIERHSNTLVEPGDVIVDLGTNDPPIIATAPLHFMPIDRRYLNIQRLKKGIEQMLIILESSLRKGSVSLVDRMHRDMLSRLRESWEIRSQRGNDRVIDGQTPVLTSIGLEAAHHYISDEQKFQPEKTEARWQSMLRNPLKFPASASKPASNRRSSSAAKHINNAANNPASPDKPHKSTIWDDIHDIQFNFRQERESKLSGYIVEPWQRINHSLSGVALRRLGANRVAMYVGSLVAFRDDKKHEVWRVGAIRWLQDNGPNAFDMGIVALANESRSIAVRAISADDSQPGSTGKYHRGLIIGPILTQKEPEGLVVPANLYTPGTELILNEDDSLVHIKLQHLIETSATFSVFAFERSKFPDTKNPA